MISLKAAPPSILLSVCICCLSGLSFAQYPNRRQPTSAELQNEKRRIDSIYMEAFYRRDSIRISVDWETRMDNMFTQLLVELGYSIEKQTLPASMLNSCLDQENISYCYWSLHHRRSLRNDLIRSLTDKQKSTLKVIFETRYPKIRYSICPEKDPKLPFRNQSTYSILLEAMSK
jgi:hypothetical protein